MAEIVNRRHPDDRMDDPIPISFYDNVLFFDDEENVAIVPFENICCMVFCDKFLTIRAKGMDGYILRVKCNRGPAMKVINKYAEILERGNV